MTDNFYKNLKSFDALSGVSDANNFFEAPSDWSVVLTDVRGSTKAIEEGRYKDVNLIGAACITAVKNEIKELDVPFVFGGDGATLLVPTRVLGQTLDALKGVARVAKTMNLALRVGFVPHKELIDFGQPVLVGRYQMSAQASLAMFSGGGLNLAEEWIKQDSAHRRSVSDQDLELYQGEPNLEGLECRWKPIPSQQGEILTVLVRALHKEVAQNLKIYESVIHDIEAVAGDNKTRNPAKLELLKTETNPLKLQSETRVRAALESRLGRLRYAVGLFVATLYGRIVFGLNLKTGGVDWAQYKKDVAAHSDYWKYDDVLRFVIDVSPEQKEKLLGIFDSRRAHGDIAYGVQSSRQALMTCLVFDRTGDHLHFIDGGDGGYALAAKELKRQLKEKS
jgi:hypothetical protein